MKKEEKIADSLGCAVHIAAIVISQINEKFENISKWWLAITNDQIAHCKRKHVISCMKMYSIVAFQWHTHFTHSLTRSHSLELVHLMVARDTGQIFSFSFFLNWILLQHFDIQFAHFCNIVAFLLLLLWMKIKCERRKKKERRERERERKEKFNRSGTQQMCASREWKTKRCVK